MHILYFVLYVPSVSKATLPNPTASHLPPGIHAPCSLYYAIEERKDRNIVNVHAHAHARPRSAFIESPHFRTYVVLQGKKRKPVLTPIQSWLCGTETLDWVGMGWEGCTHGRSRLVLSLSSITSSKNALLLRDLGALIILLTFTDQALELKLLCIPHLLAIRGTVPGQADRAIRGGREGDVAIARCRGAHHP